MIRNGIIEAIGNQLPLPEAACTVIDAHGQYLMPGLINMHTHLGDNPDDLMQYLKNCEFDTLKKTLKLAIFCGFLRFDPKLLLSLIAFQKLSCSYSISIPTVNRINLHILFLRIIII